MVYFAVVHLFFCDHFATCRLKNIFSVAFFSSQRMPHILPSVNPPGSAFGMAGRIFYAFFHPPPPRKARSQPKRRDSPCVAVAWWSWPDEPAALNTPQAKRILLREAQRPGKAKKPLSGNSTAYLQNVNLLRTERKNDVTRKGSRCQQASEVALFCPFSRGREKQKMKTFVPRGNIYGPILPQFILEKPVSLGAKIMYALLCNYASEKDHCWPPHATLAAKLSCSVSSVKNYLAELVKANCKYPLVSAKLNQSLPHV